MLSIPGGMFRISDNARPSGESKGKNVGRGSRIFRLVHSTQAWQKPQSAS